MEKSLCTQSCANVLPRLSAPVQKSCMRLLQGLLCYSLKFLCHVTYKYLITGLLLLTFGFQPKALCAQSCLNVVPVSFEAVRKNCIKILQGLLCYPLKFLYQLRYKYLIPELSLPSCEFLLPTTCAYVHRTAALDDTVRDGPKRLPRHAACDEQQQDVSVSTASLASRRFQRKFWQRHRKRMHRRVEQVAFEVALKEQPSFLESLGQTSACTRSSHIGVGLSCRSKRSMRRDSLELRWLRSTWLLWLAIGFFVFNNDVDPEMENIEYLEQFLPRDCEFLTDSPLPCDIRGGPCHCKVTGLGCSYVQQTGTPFCLYCDPTRHSEGRCSCPCRACDPTESDWSSSERGTANIKNGDAPSLGHNICATSVC